MSSYVKESIADSLVNLMKKNSFESISITEICDCAQVNRASYYRNFKSKEEVLLYKVQLLWQRWDKEYSTLISEDALKQIADTFSFFLSIRGVLIPIYSAGLPHILLRHISVLIGPNNEDDIEDVFRRSFFTLGIYGVASEWIKRGMTQSPEEMASLIAEKIMYTSQNLAR
jgi:AcrR family transcriptional regulator